MGAKMEISGQDFTTRAVQRAAMDALEIAVEVWHSRMLPKHFTASAAREYNYAPRTKGYMIRKARKMKHQRQLVWSGESEAAAKYDFKIQSTRIEGRSAAFVAMMMPGYFVKTRNPAIDKPAEMTRTTPSEERELEGVFIEQFTRNLGLTTRVVSAA